MRRRAAGWPRPARSGVGVNMFESENLSFRHTHLNARIASAYFKARSTFFLNFIAAGPAQRPPNPQQPRPAEMPEPEAEVG